MKKKRANPRPGVDGFPYLEEDDFFTFPAKQDESSTLACWGGNLSPGMLLSAYEQGLFPWFSPGEPVMWHFPDPRFGILADDLTVSQSMEKILRQGRFDIYYDRDVPAVIEACASITREGQDGTWIGPSIKEAYGLLADRGFVHSAEAWRDGELVGGCYGLRLGRVFFGESMFSRVSNASKAAFIHLARELFEDGLMLIDCQVYTPHLESLGGSYLSGDAFLHILDAGDAQRKSPLSRRGSWLRGLRAESGSQYPVSS